MKPSEELTFGADLLDLENRTLHSLHSLTSVLMDLTDFVQLLVGQNELLGKTSSNFLQTFAAQISIIRSATERLCSTAEKCSLLEHQMQGQKVEYLGRRTPEP